MKLKCQALFLIVLLCASQVSALAESKPLELKWNEVGTMIVGQRVELTLADGSKVKGEAAAVREDSMVIDVKKSTGEKKYAKGSATIPLSSIGLVRLERTRSSWGRSMGTIIGVLGGLVLGGFAAAHTDGAAAGISVFLVIAAGSSITGYFAGKELDRRVTLIKIVP